jgi:transposase-like protein
MTNLTAPRFIDADAAREHLEALHWPQGPFCPHCGSVDAKRLPEQRGKPSKRSPEGSIRKGVIQCNGCRKQFTVTVGTVFADSKVPLNKWLLATHLLCASKKGMSAHQLHRMIGVTYKTAWFMFHRIREAMKSNDPDQFGEDGGMVEVDETFIGREPGTKLKPGFGHKMKVLALVDRNTGRSRAVVVDSLKAKDIAPIMFHNIAREARLMTDEAYHYGAFSAAFSDHQTVNHSKLEYGRGEAHTNTIEGYFSIFKRGMKGIYQHCAKTHLHRYLAEFDFRYTNRIANGVNDDQRAEIALKGIAGRRLTYRRIGLAA